MGDGVPFREIKDITVELVDEDQLPEGHAWALVRKCEDEPGPPCKLLFVKRTVAPWVMAHIAETLKRNHLAS